MKDIDISLLSVFKVTNEDADCYMNLLQHYGYGDMGQTPFEAMFQLYGNEIITHSLSVGDDYMDRRSARECTQIFRQLFSDNPLTNIWDIAFNLRLFDYAQCNDWTSIADLRQLVTEKAIQNPLYLPFVSESQGVILWLHQAQNILSLFFENRHVFEHYVRELGQKRIPARERLNQVNMPGGEGLGDFLCQHSLGSGIFAAPNLSRSAKLWQIVNGLPFRSANIIQLIGGAP